jgi:hypothetical protein
MHIGSVDCDYGGDYCGDDDAVDYIDIGFAVDEISI